MDFLIDLVKDKWPELSVIAILCIGVAKTARMATRLEYKNDQRHKDSGKRLTNIENALKDISRRISTIERFLIKNGGANCEE